MLAAATLSLAALASACGGSDSGTVQGVELVNKDALTVCTHLPYKPFEFGDDNGETVGFDVDVTNLLAKKLGVKYEVVDIDWNSVTSGAAYKAGKCDVGMGAMTITPERQAAILISDPYFDATQALMAKNSAGITSIEDLKGKKVGVQADTTGELYANKLAKQYGYTTVVFDDLVLQVNAVKAGTIDAAINDNGALYDFVNDNKDTSVVEEFDTGEKYGFAMEKDNANATKLMAKLNDAMAEATKDGEMDTIYKKWFGKVPGNVNQ